MAQTQLKPAGPITWKKTVLDTHFRSEGVAVADVNRDGRPDILAGHVWYAAPDWTPHEIRPAPEFDGATRYSHPPLRARPGRRRRQRRRAPGRPLPRRVLGGAGRSPLRSVDVRPGRARPGLRPDARVRRERRRPAGRSQQLRPPLRPLVARA